MITKCFDHSRWRYVQTDVNPADIASRKQSVDTLVNSCWLKGPGFLWNRDEHPIPDINSELPETMNETTTLKTDSSGIFPFKTVLQRCSSLTKAKRVAKCLINFTRRLANKVKRKKNPAFVPLKLANDDDALKVLVGFSQLEAFGDYYKASDKYHGKLSPLTPFIDAGGLIRVGGRLTNSELDYENKFPILLPKVHLLTNLVISQHHELVKHQGRCITLSSIRQSGYFIHNGSNVIRKFIRSCVTCKRMRLPLGHQQMANLPKDRLECTPPFVNTGMDVFGPYEVTDGVTTRRTKSTKKVWAVIFTCLNSRAMHLEPLPSLDISSLRNAMRRFFCLRGPCKHLRSDQGTNFVGTRNQDLISAIEDESRAHNCKWDLNTPKASHHGGVWERPIQSIKKIINNCIHLLGRRILSRDEFYTYLQECACILNNSPLWEFSADPNDPAPLSPAMLLNMRGNDPPETSFSLDDILSYGNKRWRRIQYLSDQFWCRWKHDYLQLLQKRSKWVKPTKSLAPGDVVLLKDNQAKRHQWPIAKVSAVKTGTDGLVRSVEVLVPFRGTSNLRTLHRPVNELSLLVPSSG